MAGRADLATARMWGTVLADVDLRSVCGLEAVHHEGPSTIGIDAIYASGGRIPESFLRGCGVPEEFIAYIGSIRPTTGILPSGCMPTCKPRACAARFAPEEMKAGRKIHEKIDEAIRLHDRLLLILSETA